MSRPAIKKPSDFKVMIVYPNLPMMLVPGVAIAILTRVFKDKGYDVSLFETTHYDTNEINYSENKINYSENRVKILNARKFDIEKDLGITVKHGMLKDFRRKVEEVRPDFLAFSVVEDTFLQTRTMLQEIEDLEIPHLIGGVFPTMAPEVCISAPEIDLIGLGEGEWSSPEVAEATRLGKPADKIPGTWSKAADGAVTQNPQPPLVDIDEVIPDFSLFHPSRFNRPMGGKIYRMVPVESYRGCPYACTYCNSPSQRMFAKNNDLGNFMRRNRMERLRRKLQVMCGENQPEFIFFVDDSFLARPREEIFDFCDMYEEFRLPFYFNTRAENCDAEILERLQEVGLVRIAFGIESGNEQYRQKVLRRKITNAEIIDRFKVIGDSGVPFSINLIIGMPGETRELVMDTVRLARSIKGYDTITAFIFTPYHGTPLRQVAIDNGWLEPGTITKHNTSRSLLRMPPPYLNADEIDGLLSVLPLYCYFPETEWPQIRRAEQSDEEGLRIREHYSDIYSRNFLGESDRAEKLFIHPDGTARAEQSLGDFRDSPMRIEAAALKSLTDPMIGL